MFFSTNLARELRHSLRQAVFIVPGLADGVGLAATVTAASAGVKNAQAGVLKGLYGIGTDITVTKPPPPFNPNGSGGTRATFGPGGGQVCTNGKCKLGTQTIDTLASAASGALSASTVGDVGKPRDVSTAAGGLLAEMFGSWRIGQSRPADALAKVG